MQVRPERFCRKINTWLLHGLFQPGDELTLSRTQQPKRGDKVLVLEGDWKSPSKVRLALYGHQYRGVRYIQQLEPDGLGRREPLRGQVEVILGLHRDFAGRGH